MFKILLICPFFGEFPKFQFPLWLQSCKYNPSINWLVVTDDKTKYDYPLNVKVLYTEWEEFTKRVKSCFDFHVTLDRPYKLCDYKPLYGIIFKDEIEGYDFWGYTDSSDTVYGNLRKFLTEELLSKSEKVCKLGHFTLFRNTPEINARYSLKTNYDTTFKDVFSVDTYLDIFSTDNSLAFDEFGPNSINRIYKEYGYTITEPNETFCFDIAPATGVHNFMRSILHESWMHYWLPETHGWLILWKKGKLYALWRSGFKIKKKEIGYVHFQKRKMSGTVPFDTPFLIVPNKFIKAPLLFTVFHFLYYSYYNPIYRKRYN